MKLDFKKIFYRFWPVILIFFVWFVFSSPYFIKHRVPFPSTYLVNFFSPWSAYPGSGIPVKNNAMPDVISQIYPWKTLTVSIFKNLQMPLWNPYGFSGTPLLANYQSAVLSPFNLLFFILPFVDAWSLLILLQPLLAGIFMYMLLRAFKIGKLASVLGSLSFMFCGFITTWMAYGTLAYAILYLPLALFAVEKYYDTKRKRFLVLLSVSIPLSFFSGHFQISAYFFVFVFFYILFKYFEKKDKNSLFLSFAYLFSGALFSLPQLIPSIELYLQSLRSGIFQEIEVIPWGYLPTFLAPDFLGNPVTRNDWFGHYAEWNAYIGLVPLMLSFYAVFIRKNKKIFFFALFALASILFSFQTPFLSALVFLKIPVLSTSAASRVIVIFSFSACVLAVFGFEKLFEDIKSNEIKPVFYWLGSFFIIFILLWSVILLKLFMPSDKIIIARQNLILPTLIFISFCLTVLTALILKNKNRSYLLGITPFIIILLVSFDVLRFANKWMPFDSRSLMYPNVPVVKSFKKISGYERVFGSLGQEATAYYKLPSIEGYDALYIKRYGEFIASLDTGKLTESARSVVALPKNGLNTEKALNLLGVKYIVYKKSDARSPWTLPFWSYKNETFPLIYNDKAYQILQNESAFPRAFLVTNYIVEKNPRKILNAMFSPAFNLRNNVVLEKSLGFKLTKGALGSLAIVRYTPDKILINTDSNGNSLLFLSDTYYTGWKALVDGNKTPIYRADYAFRAVFVPKGRHKVQFIYDPSSFSFGLFGALIGLLAVLALGVMGRKPTLFPRT